MNSKVKCVKNKGYKWTTQDGVYFKGYLMLHENGTHILRGEHAVTYLSSIASFDDFQKRLITLDGSYAIIIQRAESLWAAVDIARSMPLYFSRDGRFVSDSAEQIRKDLGLAPDAAEPLRLLEMLDTQFVAHNNTVYNEIGQLDMGQAVKVMNGKIHIESYFIHACPTVKWSRAQAKDELQKVSDKAFNDVIQSIGNRPVVLSLSGGYDSRYVACMLKRGGVENVSCYTYGNRDSFEPRQSRRVAEALGYRWNCVELSDQAVVGIIMDEKYSEFFKYCDYHDYVIYLQNLIAVESLQRLGWFPEGAVFLTGLCNDMPTGQYVKSMEESKVVDFSVKSEAEHILSERFAKYTLTNETKQRLINELCEKIEETGLELKHYQDFVRIKDSITTGYEHSRRYLHMNRIHEFFGYEWLLPCWNKELLKFWYSLPYEMRVQQNLYEEWLCEELCDSYGIGQEKTKLTHAKNPEVAAIKRKIGGLIVRLSLPLGVPLRRKTDINNFSALEPVLYKSIKQKKLINYERAAVTLLSTIYIMEKRYGHSFAEKIQNLVER